MHIGRAGRAGGLAAVVLSSVLAPAGAAAPQPVATACGTVQIAGGQVQNPEAARTSVACFWVAYTAGASAGLVMQVVGVDTVTTHNLSLAPANRATRIQDTVQLNVVGRPTPSSTTYTCAGLRQESTGLRVVGCGAEGDVLVPVASPVNGHDFADPAFRQTWERTDALVASGQVSRSWTWGPVPLCSMREPYAEATDGSGTHLVQYFDKSRMELSAAIPLPQPDAGRPPIDNPWAVTTGLLAYELIAGQVQVGQRAGVARPPAEFPVAGDFTDPNAPTYRSFQAVSSTPAGEHRAAPALGTLVIATLDRAGNVGNDPGKTAYPATRIASYEPATGHNIPQVFWDDINRVGPVSIGGETKVAPIAPAPAYITGLPISEAYWARVQIRGVPTDVLIQAFQRRVLTYVPSYAPPWQVQMGNVGIHYLLWRYGPQACSEH
jgi:hypothetical protein